MARHASESEAGKAGGSVLDHELRDSLARIRADYLEMPGLRLTLAEAQRLCGVDGAVCGRALETLVEEDFLCVKPGGAYARLTEGGLPRARPAKAEMPVSDLVRRAS
jgi:hypothetical protein